MRNIKSALLAFLICAGSVPAHAACWSWSKTAGANATADPSINWSEGQAPSSVNDSARAMMARLAECRDDISGALLTTGGAVAYAVTTNQGLNAVPVDGQQIVVRLNVNNGAASTLAADGGTAYAIQSAPGTGVASGTLIAGTPYRLTFNLASTAWVLQDFYNAPVAVHSVTYNKIQQVAASRLLGNATGSLADVAEIPLGTGLAFSGGSLVASPAQAPLAGVNGLVITNNAGTPNSIIDVSADMVTMVTTAGLPIWAQTISLSINTSTTGANGIDTGARAANNWYNLFLISDSTNTRGLVSLSETAPTMPGIYTYKVRIGAMRTDASGNFYGGLQRGNRMQYKLNLGALGTGYRQIFNSNAGQALWQAKSVSTFVPPTATAANVMWFTNLGLNGQAAIASNGSGATITDGVGFSQTGAGGTDLDGKQMSILLEDTNLYLGTANAVNVHTIYSLGWIDKVNAN